MAETPRVTADQIRQMAGAVDLDLSSKRVEQLVRTYGEFLDGLAAIRALDVGDRESPAITYEQETAR